MGLKFSDITDAVGITSKGAESALRDQEREARGVQKRNREQELADRLAFEEDKLAGIEELRGGFGAAGQRIISGRRLGTQRLRRGQQDSIATLLSGAQGAEEDITQGVTGAIKALQPARAGLLFGPQVLESSTLEGFGRNISDILQGGALDPLIGQRQEAATSALASAGLSRSNVAAERAAEIPADLAFDLESQLFGRAEDRFTTGLGAQSDIARLLENQGINLGNIDLGVSQGVSGLQEGGAINITNLTSEAQAQLADLISGGTTRIANLLTRQPGDLTSLVPTGDPVAMQQVKGARDKNILDLFVGGLSGGLSGAGVAGAGAQIGGGGISGGLLGAGKGLLSALG